MKPTIEPGEMHLALIWPVSWRRIRVGDVIACRSLNDADEYICKRITALEDDIVSVGMIVC